MIYKNKVTTGRHTQLRYIKIKLCPNTLQRRLHDIINAEIRLLIILVQRLQSRWLKVIAIWKHRLITIVNQ